MAQSSQAESHEATKGQIAWTSPCSKQVFTCHCADKQYYGGHFIDTSIGMVFQVCFWERRKLQLVAAFASKPVVVRYSVASWGIVEAQTSRSDVWWDQDFEI